MSCFMTSATRRSRIVPAAVLIASAAASSHDVLLVPMISVTLYTLMTLSFDGLLSGRRGAQLVLIRLTRPGTGSDRQVRRWLPDLEPGTWPGWRPGGRPCRSVSMPCRNEPGFLARTPATVGAWCYQAAAPAACRSPGSAVNRPRSSLPNLPQLTSRWLPVASMDGSRQLVMYHPASLEWVARWASKVRSGRPVCAETFTIPPTTVPRLTRVVPM